MRVNPRRTRRLSEPIPAPSLQYVSCRSTTSRRCRPKHSRHDNHPTPDEQYLFNVFRLGNWPDLYPGVQFSNEPSALDQYFRQMTPNTGPYDPEVVAESMSALFDRIGDGVLFTHSQSGGRAG